jgi:hypothetical protein
MPKKFSSEVEVRVKQLSELKYSSREIVKILKKDNININCSTIWRITNSVGKKRQNALNNENVELYKRHRTVRTPSMIKKVKELIDKSSPPSTRSLKRTLNISRATIHNIIHKDLQMKLRKKRAVHKLNERQMKIRATKARKLYEEQMAGLKYKNIVSLDESYVDLDYCNGIRRVCWIKMGEEVPNDWTYERRESFAKGFMIVGIITGRGQLPLIKVPAKVKVNSSWYITYVLQPLFDKYLPELYGKDLKNVFFHHDAASSHTSLETKRYLESVKAKHGINFISNCDIPIKGPDIAILDFFGFSYLKNQLFHRRPRTIEGFWKVCQQEWNNIDISIIEKAFCSWKRRLRMVSRVHGAHIENIKTIHCKVFK